MSVARLNRAMPAVILLLVAALVALFWWGVAGRGVPLVPLRPGAAAAAAAPLEWKMVTTWPSNFPGLGTAPVRFAQWVEDMSGGRLKIHVYGAGELVPAMQVFEAVAGGTVQMGHGAAYYWTGKLPAAAFFTTVPFGLTAQEMNGWLYHGGGMELWRRLYEPFNLVPLAAGNTGVQMAGWFNREIRSIEDFKGLKMRIPGLAGQVFERAGGTAVTLPGGEIYTSLQTGVIDATEWVGPYNDLSFGLHEVGRYYYYPGWHEPGPTLEMLVNRQASQALPADLQTIVTVAARAINQDMLDEYTASNSEALRSLVDEHGVELRALPDDVLRELRRVSRDVIAEKAAADPQFAEVYRSFTAYLKGVSRYHRLSEKAYLEARDLDERAAP